MKKLTLLKSLLLAMLLVGSMNVFGQTYLLQEDFSSITTGDNTTTNGSNTAWNGNDNFPTVNKAYQAGGAVRIGTSSATGSITSKTLDLSVNGGNFSVSFDVKGWTTVEGNITVTVTGLTAQTVTYTATMSGSFENHVLNFTGGTANSTVTIATTAKRAFIDNVKVYYMSSPTLSATTLASFGEVAIGTTAGPKTFTLTGSNLTGNVTVGALNGFTYATTETGTYASSLPLTPSGGSINQTIYVKFTPTAVQSYDGNIAISGGGATSINVAVQGSGILAAPTAIAATNVSANGFTANWSAVAGATGYQLNVYTKTGTNATDLIISEYVEGSSNNKYLEIFNGTGSQVNLSDYKVELYSNGASTASSTLTLSGTLNNNSTYVIGYPDGTIYTPNVTSNTVANFNGDDAIALKKISTGTYVDIFGRIGEDPGTAWTIGSLTTVDHTLVR